MTSQRIYNFQDEGYNTLIILIPRLKNALKISDAEKLLFMLLFRQII